MKKIDTNPLLPFTYDDLMYIIGQVKKKAPGVVETNPKGKMRRRVSARSTPSSHSSVPALDRGREQSVDSREAKAIELADRGRVIRKGGEFIVFSLNSPEKYTVTLDPVCCSCLDHETRQDQNNPCKHALAARIVLSREKDEPSAAHKTKPATVETPPISWPRKTYQQDDWSLYTLAQQEERAEFRRLLADLCSTLPLPASQKGTKGGKPPARLSDMIFASVYKIYSGMSGRRFTTELREAQERGYVSQALHYSTIAKCLEDKETMPVLINLIESSALPFKAIEREFAVDSSGFSASRFERWYNIKWGRMESRQRWIKAHCMTGTTTHVITSVVIDEQHSNDAPHFAPLVKTTAKGFTIDQATADKAYGSAENFQAVEDCGGVAYIAFRKSTTGWSGGIYERMYHLFCLNKDDYLAHYHRRSNIESSFSAVKRLMGNGVRSTSDVAMKNEVLGKLLAYNITLLVHAIYELNLDPTFGEDGRDEKPAILPFIRHA